MTTRRVLLDTRVLNTRQPTGLSRYASTLFENLVRRGRAEYLVADGGTGLIPGAHAPAVRRASRRCRRCGAMADGHLPVVRRRSRLLALSARSRKLAGTSVVLTVHDLIALDHPEWFADASVHRFFAGPLRASARDADQMITGSADCGRIDRRALWGRPGSHHCRAPRGRPRVLRGAATRPRTGDVTRRIGALHPLRRDARAAQEHRAARRSVRDRPGS